MGGGLTLGVCGNAAAQQVVPQRGRINTDAEVDSVSGWRVGIEASFSPILGGEAFEDLGVGGGLDLVATTEFGERIAVDVSGGMSVHNDHLTDPIAKLVEASLHVRWRSDPAPTGLTFGPIIGVTWFHRDDFEEWVRGFHAGAGLRFETTLGARWAVVVRTDVTWVGFAQLPLPFVPPDPDHSSFGGRGTLQLGLTRRIGAL